MAYLSLSRKALGYHIEAYTNIIYVKIKRETTHNFHGC